MHLELRVEPLFRLVENGRREVRRHDLDTPACHLSRLFLQDHGERVRLLPGGTGRGPDAQGLRRTTRFQKLRQNDVLELVERPRVAEEEGFIGRHRLDDVEFERRARTCTELRGHIVDRGQTVLAGHRTQPAFEQVGLVLTQHETGAVAQKRREEIEIGLVHAALLSTFRRQ